MHLSIISSLLLFLLFGPLGATVQQHPLLILNSIDCKGALPANFRSTSTLKKHSSGLKKLNMSGSGQFAESGLDELLKKLDVKKITIIDLRQESHGFANSQAVSLFVARDWINKNKTLYEIENEEAAWLGSLLKEGNVTCYNIDTSASNDSPEILVTLALTVNTTTTEKELCRSLKIDYKRFPTTDHVRPTDEIVNQFITFVRNRSSKQWFHFHCEGGEGRTTTFMAMLDMLHNAKQRSFTSIIARQAALGGIDLASLPSEDSWKYPYAKQRLEFLSDFYNYCKSGRQAFTSLKRS